MVMLDGIHSNKIKLRSGKNTVEVGDLTNYLLVKTGDDYDKKKTSGKLSAL